MIKIVTDSSSYFKKQEAEEFGVKIIPLNYTIDNQNYSESFIDQNENYVERLKSSSKISTAHANPSTFLSCFEEELSSGHEILCITISSRLSGTFSAAFLAAKQTESKKVAVFDSHLAAGGLFLLVNEAKKLIDKGKTLDEISQSLLEIRNKIKCAFSVDNIAPLRESGRIGRVRMRVGTILNDRPILLCQDGGIIFDTTVQGNSEIIRALTSKVPQNAKEAVVNYIENTKLASDLYNFLRQKHPQLPIKLQKIGPVLGIHLGLHVVALSVISS